MRNSPIAAVILSAAACIGVAADASAQPPRHADGLIATAAGWQTRALASTASSGRPVQQPPIPNGWFEATQLLRAGDYVQVAIDDGTLVSGRFRAADGQSLTIAAGASVRQLSRGAIVRLSAMRGTRRRRHESIGMAVGAVIGGSIWARLCGKRESNCQEDTMLYFGGPILAGGWIGHALPARPVWRDIYVR